MTGYRRGVDLADRADYWLDASIGEGDETWVTFGSMSYRQPVLGRFIESRRASALHVISRTDDWYRRFDPDDLLRPLDSLRSGRVVLFGVSMGGFGALMFSRLIAPDVAICVSPQTIVDGALTLDRDERFRERWTAIEASGPRHGPDATLDLARCPIAIVLDPAQAEDVWHADRLTEPMVERFAVRSSGHDTLGTLRSRQIFAGVVNYLADGDFEPARRLIERPVPPGQSENPWVILAVRP